MNEKVLGCLIRGLSRSRSLCSVGPESVRSKHISLLLHTHPNQAYPFSFTKVKESLLIKRPQVRILPSAPHTACALRAVGGFSFCLVLLGFFPLCGLCGMGRGVGWGFVICLYSLSRLVRPIITNRIKITTVLPLIFPDVLWFFRGSALSQIVSHRPEMLPISPQPK